MKIAFFSPSWPYGQNGIITYVRNISRALHEQGHEISIITFDARGSLGYERVVPISELSASGPLSGLLRKVLSRLCSGLASWRDPGRAIAKELQRLQRSGDVDVFEMEETFGFCGVVAERTDIPVIARLHGPYFLNGVYETKEEKLDPEQLRREGEAISRVASVSAPSRQVLDATREYYGLQRQMSVIPNPVPAPPQGQTWSLERSDPDAILFVGRTDSRKGGDLVLRVFERLLNRRPSLRLHFVGADNGFVDADPGVTWTGYVNTRLKPETRRQITYHGVLQPDQIAQLRPACRVTLVFSRYETFALVCAEALAAGCPLVATSVGGIPEVVHHEITGLLADVDDPDDLTHQVDRLLSDPGLAARLGAAGRQFCLESLQPSAVAGQTVDAYRRTLGGRRPA